MSFAQLIFIGIGVLIILSSVDFKSLYGKATVVPVPPSPPVPPPAPKPVMPVVEKEDELVTVVKKWQDLKDECIENNLTEAVAKLDEIFPMLIKVDNK